MDKKALLEGVLFALGQPVSVESLSEVLEWDQEEVQSLLNELSEDFQQPSRGMNLKKVAGGYQLRTKPELKEIMARFFEKRPPRLTQAMLEVLSIIAYKQPTTRPEVDKIRGVDSSGAIKTLLERSLIEMRGRSDGVGNPVLYATTPKFLEWFQIGSLGDLPPLAEMEALGSSTEEASENLLHLLNKDEGFAAEDLRSVDDTLHELSKHQRDLMNNINEANAAGEETELPEINQVASESESPSISTSN
ncbi:MAG: SMC-Scp complex subunit ScpB [Bdellovibrionota bacterium]